MNAYLVDALQQLHLCGANLAVDLRQVSEKSRHNPLRRLGQGFQFLLQALQGWWLVKLQTQVGLQAFPMSTAQVTPGVDMLG